MKILVDSLSSKGSNRIVIFSTILAVSFLPQGFAQAVNSFKSSNLTVHGNTFVEHIAMSTKSSKGPRQWGSIASSADGTHLIAAENFGNLVTSSNSGLTWIDRTSAGARNWNSVASSSDGSKLVAVVGSDTGTPGASGGEIYTSTDFGATWTARTSAGNRWWCSVTMSSDGTHIAATISASAKVVGTGATRKKVIIGTDIFTSTDSGATWTDQTGSSPQNWGPITSNSDGTHLAAAVAYNGDIFTSSDSGATWIDQASSGHHNWMSIASSSDGTHLVATSDDGPGGDIFTSADSGATWTDQSSAGSRYWGGVSSSSNGKKLAAVVNTGYLYTSSDYGVTWTARKSAGAQGWNDIAPNLQRYHIQEKMVRQGREPMFILLRILAPVG